MSLLFNPPTSLRGSPQEQAAQIHTFLYQMTEQLNVALRSLSPDNFLDTEIRDALKVIGASVPSTTQKAMVERYNNLKAIIIKTAGTIESTMESIQTDLQSNYLALSEFGTFQEELTNTITAAADSVIQAYGYDALLTSFGEDLEGFETYQIQTDQYIKTGLLYFDDDSVPRYGVAVGENLTTIEVDGVETVSRAGLAATFTSDRLSFWQNEVEVAYVSSSKLYINEAVVLSKLYLENWLLDTGTSGFSIKWAAE